MIELVCGKGYYFDWDAASAIATWLAILVALGLPFLQEELSRRAAYEKEGARTKLAVVTLSPSLLDGTSKMAVSRRALRNLQAGRLKVNPEELRLSLNLPELPINLSQLEGIRSKVSTCVANHLANTGSYQSLVNMAAISEKSGRVQIWGAPELIALLTRCIESAFALADAMAEANSSLAHLPKALRNLVAGVDQRDAEADAKSNQ